MMQTITTSDEFKDRISELPCCLLGFILSFLTVKDALKTSILSRRWRYLYTERLHLHLHPSDILSTTHQEKEDCDFRKRRSERVEQFEFLTRADHIVHRFLGKPLIYFKVHSFPDDCCWPYLDKWINKIIYSGVEKIELLFLPEPCRQYQYDFPYWLFSSRPRRNIMLNYLRLQECDMMAPGDFHEFSSLRTLVLRKVVLAEDFVTNLFINCMQLEDLTLDECRISSTSSTSSTLRVIGPSLIHLKLLLLYPFQSYVPRIEISAENLTTFEYSGNTKEICHFQAPRLEKIFFHADYFVDILHALEKFARFPRLEILLHRMVNRVGVVERVPESIGVFRNLRQLSFSVTKIAEKHRMLYNPSWILSFLKAAPLLQKLQLTFAWCNLLKNRKRIQIECGIVHDELKEFEVHGYVDNWYVTELAKIVLGATTKLERMVISPSPNFYIGNGRFSDLRKPDWSVSESCKDSIRKKLQNDVPATVQFVILKLVFSS